MSSSHHSGNPTPSPVASSLRLVTIAQLAELLGELQRGTPGILSATLASADGFTVASTLSNSQDADRLSAMSGSLSALAGAMTREAGHSAPERLILESGSGHIVSMNVPVPSGDLVLTVVTNESSLLGKLLWSCRNTADQVVAACAAAPQPGSAPSSSL
ncbi:MAG: roadblock/LC7 domain-containing protein [Pseudomonadota bacterium]